MIASNGRSDRLRRSAPSGSVPSVAGEVGSDLERDLKVSTLRLEQRTDGPAARSSVGCGAASPLGTAGVPEARRRGGERPEDAPDGPSSQEVMAPDATSGPPLWRCRACSDDTSNQKSPIWRNFCSRTKHFVARSMDETIRIEQRDIKVGGVHAVAARRARPTQLCPLRPLNPGQPALAGPTHDRTWHTSAQTPA